MEEKYDKVRKTLKEIESTYNKQLSQMEKEKAIYQEKLANIEQRKSESEMKWIEILFLGVDERTKKGQIYFSITICPNLSIFNAFKF